VSSQGVVALAHPLHPLDDRVVLSGQAHRRVQTLAILCQVAVKRIRRKVGGEAQVGHAAQLDALLTLEAAAGRQQSFANVL